MNIKNVILSFSILLGHQLMNAHIGSDASDFLYQLIVPFARVVEFDEKNKSHSELIKSGKLEEDENNISVIYYGFSWQPNMIQKNQKNVLRDWYGRSCLPKRVACKFMHYPPFSHAATLLKWSALIAAFKAGYEAICKAIEKRALEKGKKEPDIQPDEPVFCPVGE